MTKESVQVASIPAKAALLDRELARADITFRKRRLAEIARAIAKLEKERARLEAEIAELRSKVEEGGG